MKKSVIVSGSIAVDTLFYHNAKIQDSLKITTPLSAAFNVRTLENFWGGCAGNIIFNVGLIRAEGASHTGSLENFHLLGIVGNDFSEYRKWLESNKISCEAVTEVKEAATAHAYVMSDSQGQQLTFFYEGPGLYKEEGLKGTLTHLQKLLPTAGLIHVAPNSLWFMTACMEQALAHQVPYFFDPGQAINLFTKEELTTATARAHGLFVNEYEYERAREILNQEPSLLLINADTSLEFILITKAEKGSTILLKNGDSIEIAPTTHAAVDPTGCGDAYRGAFLHELALELEKNGASLTALFADQTKTRELLERAGFAGSLLAGRCLAVKGTQRHTVS